MTQKVVEEKRKKKERFAGAQTRILTQGARIAKGVFLSLAVRKERIIQ
jgi:hypothetical protein